MSVSSMCKRLYGIYLGRNYHVSGGRFLLENYFGNDYRKAFPSIKKMIEVHRCHNKGFSYSDWVSMNLNRNSYKRYMSTVQYCAIHPINGRFSKWIDDKLTLKYICVGTELSDYLPDYYFQIDDNGAVLVLVDCPRSVREPSVEAINLLLKEKQILAFKKISGTIGQGFYRAEFIDGTHYLNGEQISENTFIQAIQSLRGYIVLEYLKPHEYLAEFSAETVNCIRYTAGRINGELVSSKNFIRFGTKETGYVENYGAGGVLCFIDDENGSFSNGNILRFETNKNEVIERHPDNGRELAGIIPCWDQIKKAVRDFGRVLPQLDYLGFDFVVTDNNKVKVLEINSFTTLSTLQFYDSILESEVGVFFKDRF